MSEPFIIMSAPNGARRQKADHPNLPITPHEMARCAAEIIRAGASILHLHVRDDHNAHSLDVGRYQASIAAIEDAVGQAIIIQVTTEAVGRYSRFEQMDMVKELRPEAVSLGLREICPSDDELSEMTQFIDWMTREHIFPQYILYDETDYLRFEAYRKQGVFRNDRPFALFVLGSYQGRSPVRDAMTERMKQRTKEAVFPWAVCGFGTNEVRALAHAVDCNGHIRVGFENNIWRKEGQLLSTHAEMIQFCSDAAGQANRAIATIDDVRNQFEVR